MSKVFLISALIVGTIIGAGFASGREIVAFFGQTPSPLIALVVAVATFGLTALYLFVGKKAKCDNIDSVHAKVGGKAQTVLSVITLTNCAVTVSAMLSGMDALFCTFLPVRPLFSVIFALLSTLIVINGKSGLLKAGGVIVPLLIVVIVAVSLAGVNQPVNSPPTLDTMLNAVPYVALNAMLSASTLATVSDLTNRQIVCSALISSLVIGFLTLLITLALGSNAVGAEDMPMVAISTARPALFILATIGVACAIFTTLISAHSAICEWFLPVCKNRIFSAVITAIACLILSFIGFKQVVDNLYPALAVVGICYAVINFVYLVKRPRGNERRICSTGQLARTSRLQASTKWRSTP